MIQGVLFDLDNTLADFLRMKKVASEEAARAMVDAGARFEFPIAEAGQRLYDHYLERGIDGDDAFETFLSQHSQGRLATAAPTQDRILAAGITAYLRAKDAHLTTYPGVRRVLIELTRRQYRLGVVTDAPRLKGWQRLTRLSVAEFFDVVVTHDDTGAQKPDPEPFLLAVNALGLKPHQVAFVGDWPERDIRGATLAGLKAIHAAYGTTASAKDVPEASAVIHDPQQLLNVLDSWKTPAVPT